MCASGRESRIWLPGANVAAKETVWKAVPAGLSNRTSPVHIANPGCGHTRVRLR